jgi:DNA (cytosine-5)-methyltransferase 1
VQLVLSLFSGIGLLDKAFKEAGFCVVSAGDIIFGNHFDICNFVAPNNKFDGVIAGSPCQDFSKANRDRPVVENSYGFKMLNEFKRVVLESNPQWALLENVPNVPDVTISGYYHQRIDINQAWFDNVNRLRHIQFFNKDECFLQIERYQGESHSNLSCALASDDRPFKELVKLQGLDSDFDINSFTVKGKKKAVGNGVPLSIGRVLAKAVTDLDKIAVTSQRNKYCSCGCGRIVIHRGYYYDYSCRKRAQRKRVKTNNDTK